MRGFLIGILVVILLVLVAWWAGWFDVRDTDDGKEIDINREEFKQDVDEAGKATEKAIKKTDEAIDEATDEDRQPARVP